MTYLVSCQFWGSEFSQNVLVSILGHVRIRSDTFGITVLCHPARRVRLSRPVARRVGLGEVVERVALRAPRDEVATIGNEAVAELRRRRLLLVPCSVQQLQRAVVALEMMLFAQ